MKRFILIFLILPIISAAQTLDTNVLKGIVFPFHSELKSVVKTTFLLRTCDHCTAYTIDGYYIFDFETQRARYTDLKFRPLLRGWLKHAKILAFYNMSSLIPDDEDHQTTKKE